MFSTDDYNETIFTQQSITSRGRRGAFGSQNQTTLIGFQDIIERERLEGNKQKVLEYALKELEAKKISKLTSDTAINFNNVGFIYYLMGERGKASNYLETSLDILNELKGNRCSEYEQVSQNLKLMMDSGQE